MDCKELLPDTSRKTADMATTFLLENGKSQVAHKVYAMDILYKVSRSITEIKSELAAIIERSIKHENTACRNTGRKILQKIYREIS